MTNIATGRDASDGGQGPSASPMSLASELKLHRDWRQTRYGPQLDLRGVDLSGENLEGVDFTGAMLDGANFRNAKLADAQFAWASLAHADFAGALGLIGAQFARANLSGARLPDGLRFPAFETAGTLAEGTTKLFLSVLLVCAYSWLTISSTLDEKLLTDSASSKLPIVNADVPIVNFFTLVPLVLVGMAILFMLQAQRLWSALARSPAAMPDGVRLSDQVGSWVVGAWAAERVARPEDRGMLAKLQANLFIFIGWWVVPITVAWFWTRYLHRHDWSGTVLQIIALTVGCTAAAAFLVLARRTLPRAMPAAVAQEEPAKRSSPTLPAWLTARPELLRGLPALATGFVVTVLACVVSYAAINGVHRGVVNGALTDEAADARPALALERGAPAVQAILPKWLETVGVKSVAQFSEAEVSTRLASSASGDTTADAKASGAHLVGADLRFAAAERAYLALADLRYADLLGADLYSADLRGTNIVGANFTGASLYGADLRKARANSPLAVSRDHRVGGAGFVDTLFCSRALFMGANVRYARFDGSDMRGASFDDAQVQGTSFNRTRLTHATFIGADLGGTDFRGAIGITPEQILAARHVDGLYEPDFLAALKAKAPARFTDYDVAAAERERDQRRLSGEDEPDTLNTADRRARDSVIRAAFVSTAPEAPSDATLAQWEGQGSVAHTSKDVVPPGCVAFHVAMQGGKRTAAEGRP